MLLEEEQMSIFGQDTWSGKTSPDHSPQTEVKTSQRSLKKQSGSLNRKPPLFLFLKRDGQQQDASWENAGALLGVFSTHSFGESPSVAVESHLSQILEDTPHPKYSLSEKACRGILNRANRRGRKLPEPLENALRSQCLAPSKSVADVAGGKGALIQEDKSATLSTLQDQTLFQPIPIADQATRFSGKRGDKADGKGNGLGVGNPGDPMNTLTGGKRHAVAVDCRNGVEGDVNGTLQAKSNGGISYNCNNVVRTYL